MIEIPEDLQGGSTKVTKMGSRVLRARHQGSTNVEWLLTVLERRGFRYSPRFLGLSDDGRQVLEFMEGRAGNYPPAHGSAQRRGAHLSGPGAAFTARGDQRPGDRGAGWLDAGGG